MAKNNNLTDFLTDIANTIRATDGTATNPLTDANKIDPQDFSSRIVNYQNKTVTPSATEQTITKDSGYMALGTVTVKANSEGPKATVTSGTSYSSVSKTITYDSTNSRFNVALSGTVSAPTVGTAGYISSTLGTKNTSTATGSTTLPLIALNVGSSGTLKVTPVVSNVSASVTDKIQITASPSTSTSEISTYYMAVNTDAKSSTVTLTPNVSTAGYGDTSHATKTTPTISVGANASGTYYIPVASGSIAVSGGTVSATAGTASASASASQTGMTAGVSDTATSYYFTSSASASATGGNASITDVKDTRTQGWIATRSATTIVTGDSKTGSSASDSDTSTVYLKAAGVTVAGGGLSKGTASGGGLSGGGLTQGTASGGGLSGNDISGSKTAGSVTIAESGTFFTKTGFGITTSKPSGTDGTNYLTVHETYSTGSGSVTGSTTITRAAFSQTVNRAKVDRAAFSQTVSRADVTDTRSAGYLPARASTTVISGTSETVSLAAGSIAADSSTVTLAEGTKVVSASFSVTPSVTDNFEAYYIPIVSASATGGTASASVTSSGISTSSSATSYYVTASASATGGSASVGAGATTGASASGTSASDSKTIYIPEATFAAQGADINCTSSGYTGSGTVFTMDSGSVTPGAAYATLSSAGSSATSVTSRYFKITPNTASFTAGYISSANSGTVQNYTIQAAEFEVSGASVKTKSGKAGWVDANTTVGTVATGSATTPATTITANPGSPTWDSTNNNYKITVSKTQNVTPTISTGYITSGSGTAGTITVSGASTLNQATWTQEATPSGETPTNLTFGGTYTLAAGYYPTARYYKVPSGVTPPSGNIELTQSTSTDVAAYATATVRTVSGSAYTNKTSDITTSTSDTSSGLYFQGAFTASTSGWATGTYNGSYNYITDIAIPATKTLKSITLTQGNSSTQTHLSTLTVNSYATVDNFTNAGLIGNSTTTKANNASSNTNTMYIPHGTSGAGNVYVAPYTSGTTYTFYKIINNGSLVTGTVTASSPTVSVSSLTFTKNTTTGKYDITGSNTGAITVASNTAGYISGSVGTRNGGTATASVSASVNEAAFTVDGASVKTTSTGAGYIAASTTVGTVASGSATGNAGTITYVSHTQDSTNKKKFTVTGSVTAPAPTVSQGYVSSGTAGTATNRTVSLTITDAQAQAAVGAGSVTISDSSLSVSPSVTPAATVSASGSSVTLGTKTTTQPISGRYITVTGGNTATTGSATSGESSTVTKTAGYITAGTSTISSTATATAAANSTTAYYPIDSSAVTVSDSTLSVSPSVTPNAVASATGNISLTSQSSQPSGYYIKVTGGNSATTGSATSGESSTVTWTAGYTDASTSSTQKTISSTATASAVANSKDQYYSVPTATFTVDGNVVKTTSTGGGYIENSTNAGTISGGTVSANSPTITPSISSTYTSGSGYAITGTATTSVSVGTAGYISSSIGTRNTGTASISGYVAQSTTGAATTSTTATADRTIGYNQQTTISAGYYPSDRIVRNSVGAGTIDVTDLTITPKALSGAWNSTNNKYVVSQESITATMQSTVTTAGYVSSSVGTKNTGTATVSAPSNLEIPKATFTVDGASVKTTSNGAGYIPASTTVGTVSNGTIANNTTLPSGSTSSGTLNGGSYIKIGAGYYASDSYYMGQAATTLTGDATEANVLSGKTFYSDSYTKKTGNMTNNGTVTKTLDTTTTSYTIPAGYHNGSGTVSITTQTKAASGSGTVTPDSGKVLSSVTVAAKTGASAGVSGTNNISGTNCDFSPTNNSGIVISASATGVSKQYTVSTAGWIGTGTYGGTDGTINATAKYLNSVTIDGGNTFSITNSGTTYIVNEDDGGGDPTLDISVVDNYGYIKVRNSEYPDFWIVDMRGNEVKLTDNLGGGNTYTVTDRDGQLILSTLPSSTSASSSGTSQATIAASTSTRYLNIPAGYNPSSKYYTLSAMPTMTLPSSTSTTASGTSKATIAASTSTRYLNIPSGYNGTAQYYTLSAVSNHTGAASSTTTGSLSLSSANVTFTNTDNGIYIQPSAYGVSRNYSVSTAGWITANTYGDTSGSLTGSKVYISKITVPKDIPFAVDMTADTAYDTTSYLTINNAAYRRISVTNVANSTVGITSSSGNGTVNITQVNSINLGYNITGSTVQQSFTIPSLSIYSYNSSYKTTVTTLANSTNSVIGTYSGSGTITNYTNTGAITYMTGTRTLSYLGNSSTSGTLNITNLGYNASHTGTIVVAESKFGYATLQSTNPNSSTLPTWIVNYPMTSLADGSSGSSFRYLWFKSDSGGGNYLAAIKTSISGGASFYSGSFTANSNKYLFDMSTTASMYFELVLFFSSPLAASSTITIQNASSTSSPNGYNANFVVPKSCNGVIFRMIRRSTGSAVYIDIHPTFLY